MLKKHLAVTILLITALLAASGCSSKNPALNQNVKTLVTGYQQSMVTFFDIKNMQDNSALLTQINDNMRKIEDSKKKLAQISGYAEVLTDEKAKAELVNFINICREREKLALKYLNDIRRDLDHRYKNPDSPVNINAYITNIPNHLLDLEYRSEQSVQRLEKMLNKK